MSTQQIPKTPATRKRTTSEPPPPVQQEPVWKKAHLGLAKPEAKLADVESTTGRFRSDETERTHLTDGQGRVNGSSHEREVSTGSGSKVSSELKTGSFDGTTSQESETTSETFVGVEAAAKMLKKHSPDEISVGIETLARAGAFGEAKKSAAIKRGLARASYEAEGAVGAGFEAKMEAAATIDRTGAIPALLATIEASARAGLWVEGSFTGTAGLGPVEAKLAAEVGALIGVEAQMKAEASFNAKDGAQASFAGSVFAGAKANAGGSIEVGIPNKAQIELGAEAEAMAGAEAKLEGGITISLKGVSATFKAEAFAGAKASATGKASIKLMGKKILSAEGTVEVSAGAGGTVEGEFTFLNGKLKLSAKLAATLGVGAGADAKIEVDLGVLATVIYAKLYEVGKSSSDPVVKDVSPDFKRVPLTDPVEAAKKREVGHDAVYESFLAYARKKTMKGKGIGQGPSTLGGVTRDQEGIKRERVQAIIKEVAPLLRADLAYIETDEGIQDAALEAFQGHISGIVVDHGTIRSWSPTNRVDAAALREKTQAEEKMRQVRDPLLDELHGYCRKKMAQGTTGVTQSGVQKILDKHYKKLLATFVKPGEPDEVISFVAEEMVTRYLSAFEVKSGKITAFVVDEAKTTAMNDETALEKSNAAIATAMQTLDGGLASYLSSVVAKQGATIDGKGLTKQVKAATKSISGELSKPEVNELIKLKILGRLGDAVQGVEVKDGAVTALVLRDGGLAGLRTTSGEDKVEAARQACADSFTRSLGAYRSKKSSKGAVGLKQAKVQALLDSALKSEQAWKTSGQADAALAGAARKALGDDLSGITITKGVVETFNYDNAKLGAEKEFKKEYGTAKLEGGEEDDNQRRSLVTAAVRAPLKAVCDQFRSQAEQDPTARLDKAKLQVILDKGVKKVRADANTPAGNEALEDALQLYLPMITFVKVESLTITGLGVNDAYFAGRAEKVVSDKARETIKSALKKNGKKMTIAMANEVVAKHRAAITSVPADELDMVLQIDITTALSGLLEPNDPVSVTGGVVTKLNLKKK